MKLKKIEIEKFRHIENQTIDFGNTLTVISGLNGTGKSTILGLAGHFFVTPNSKIKTLSGKDFQTKQGEVFRLCPRYDYNQKYSYKCLIINNDNSQLEIVVNTRYMESANRLKFDIDGRKNKYKFPVIYLGLKRLFPNANEIKFNTFDSQFSKTEKAFYINEVKNIMLVNNTQSDVEQVITSNKNYYGIKTEKYAAAGNSAGQDNIGQIMTAILSFAKLPEKRGILLIDELEATLFPAAQINLVEKLYKYSKQFNLQIIFTTHSIEILKYLYQKKWSDVKINFLELKDNKVFNTVDPEIKYIEHKIKAEAVIKIPNIQKQLICEDELASYWIKGLLKGTSLLKDVNINFKNMNNGCIKQLAESNLKCFSNFIFILDADCKSKKEYKKIKNIIFLPGMYPPEVEMFKYLKNIPGSDNFWQNSQLFDYNACFNGYMDDSTETNKCKNWYNSRKQYFGRGLAKFFTKWKKDNINSTINFMNEIKAKI
ncbi:MAG: ATP-binding protein [Clostridiaceae bacterium]|jgi:predicted ATPase|nr:ATP-binding protein [Clostridiaceae bacterium]